LVIRTIIELVHLPRTLDPPDALYPIQNKCLALGATIGLTTGVLLSNPIPGLAIFVLFVIVGMLWRRNEPPVLVYCLAYQWIFVAMGYFYDLFTGTFPSTDFPAGDLDGATVLSLLGFVALVFGLRVGLRTLERKVAAHRTPVEMMPAYNIRRLFWLVIGLFSVNWFLDILPREIAFNEAHIIANFLATRDILLCLLLLSSLGQRKGYRYALVAGLFVTLPQATSQQSSFSWVFILFGLCLLREWRPWIKTPATRRRNRQIIAVSAALGGLLLFMALIWQGGVKNNWRSTLRADSQLSSPIRKMAVLAGVVDEVYSELNWNDAIASLAERMSGTLYFSHTLNYVPRIAPFENGTLTWRAINHTFKPRFLFPDKPDLGSNSWLIWQYTGLPAAGEESGTSIGLTYMAEFYIDYGRYWMFVPLFIWGLIVGLLYSGIFLISPAQIMSCATVMVLLPQPFASYEGEIAYMLGGLIQTGLVFAICLYFGGPILHRTLLRAGREKKLIGLRRHPVTPLPD